MPQRNRSRVLATVLFTDIVGSTELAGELGDRVWRELMARHNRIVRRELKRFGGRELDTTGDGFFARFHDPGSGIRCAAALTQAVRELGIEIRAGLHTGEAEVADGKLGGIAVHIGARIVSLAGAGEVLVSGTARELVTGSNLELVDRGRHTLKGVPGQWQVYEVVALEGTRSPLPLDPTEAERRRAQIHPVPFIRRRPGLITLGAALVLVSVASAVFLFSGNDSLQAIPPGSVGRLDPATGQITAALSAGSGPSSVAVAVGNVYVADEEAGIVTMFDSQTGEQLRTTSTGGGPGAMAVDEEHVWILNTFESTVVRLSLELSPQGTAELKGGPNDLAVGEGFVWLTSGITPILSRIDPDTLASTNFPLEGAAPPTGIAVGGGFVWVSAGTSVLRVDPSGEIDLEASLRYPGADLAYGEGSVWVVHPRDDAVSRLDPDTLRGNTVPVGNQPVDIVVGPGAAWVSNALDGTVTRIGSDGNAIAIDVGSIPRGLAIGRDGVWVTAGAAV